MVEVLTDGRQFFATDLPLLISVCTSGGVNLHTPQSLIKLNGKIVRLEHFIVKGTF